MKDALVEEYAPRLRELLPLARTAYGSRNTKSPQHDASREYTRLLVEYYGKGGSLIAIAEAVGVTYAGVRRRVTTVDIAPVAKRVRSKATPEQVAEAVERIKVAKDKSLRVRRFMQETPNDGNARLWWRASRRCTVSARARADSSRAVRIS